MSRAAQDENVRQLTDSVEKCVPVLVSEERLTQLIQKAQHTVAELVRIAGGLGRLVC
jgi:hypothetical protein